MGKLKRNQKRVVVKGKVIVKTYRKHTSAHYLNRKLTLEGKIYNRHRRAWVSAIAEGWDADLSSGDVERTVKRIREQVDHEEHIRDSLFYSVDKTNRAITDALPIAYDEDNDLWVTNGYVSPRKGHDYPLEAKMKFADGSWKVNSFELRGVKYRALAKDLQRQINYRGVGNNNDAGT